MKANNSMLTLFALLLLIAGCRDKTVWTEDSPYINVSSPTQNQVLQDSGSIRLKALIQPKSGPVVSYYITGSSRN